jgi:GDP dissociation inhibitor
LIKGPPSMQDALLYSVIQRQQPPSPARPLSGRDALAAVVAYLRQAGAYVDGQAPFIECSYGCGEVAQAAIRACCVHGGAAALDRMPESVLVHGGRVRGVRMADGHVVRCGALAASDSVLLAFAPGVNAPELPCTQQSAEAGTSDELAGSGLAGKPVKERQQPNPVCAAQQGREGGEYVARAIALLDAPVLPGTRNAHIVLPPGAAGNAYAITAWQCDAALRVCPERRYLLHLSTPSDKASPAPLLRRAVDALLAITSGFDDCVEADRSCNCAGNSVAKGGGCLSKQACQAQAGEASVAEQRTCLSSDRHASMQRSRVARHESGKSVPVQPHSDAAADDLPRNLCVLCTYSQAELSGVQLQLPQGIQRCHGPDASTSMDELAAHAEQVFQHLVSGCELLGAVTAGADGAQSAAELHSSDAAESAGAEDELEAALLALGS